MSDDKKVDLENPEVKAAIQAAVDEQVQGLKTKNAELITKNTKLSSELGELKQKLDGVDLEAVKGLLDKANQNEESKLIAEGKLDEVITKRTEKMRQDHEKVLAAEKQRADQAEAYANKFKQSVVRAQVVQEFVALGGRPEAAEDVANLALSQLSIDESGKAVAVDENDEVVIGKDGKSPFGAKDWTENLMETRNFYFKQNGGSGAPGSGNSTKKWSDYTEAERAAIARENPNAFKQLAQTKDK